MGKKRSRESDRVDRKTFKYFGHVESMEDQYFSRRLDQFQWRAKSVYDEHACLNGRIQFLASNKC